MIRLNSLGHQLKPPVPQIGYILLSHWPKGFIDNPIPNIRGYYQGYWLLSITCERYNLFISLNMRNLGQLPTRSFVPIELYSKCWNVLCIILEEKPKHQHHLASYSMSFNGDPPIKYNSEITEQMFWEWESISLLRFKAHSMRWNSNLPLQMWT